MADWGLSEDAVRAVACAAAAPLGLTATVDRFGESLAITFRRGPSRRR
jgi:hypothetical protein